MAYLTYPNLANTGGFPLLEGTAAVSGGNLVITFQPHAALDNTWTGAFYVKISNAVATGTQPVVFARTGRYISAHRIQRSSADSCAAHYFRRWCYRCILRCEQQETVIVDQEWADNLILT